MKRTLVGSGFVFLILFTNPIAGFGAAVTVDAGRPLSVIAETAFGIHTSVYDNQHGNANLPGRLIQSGVNTLRYPGGGYADVFHWSVSRPTLGSGNGYGLSPWFGEEGNYGYMGYQTDFGHFVQLLTNAHSQAVITVNYGSGQLWDATHSKLIVPTTNAHPYEAAAWVAYANANTNLFGTTNDIPLGKDTLGDDWHTAGFWACLRAATPLGSDDGYNFLRINRTQPIGIRYWEIGNETFGTGYYDGSDGYSVDYAVPYDGTGRLGNTRLSPARYGQRVREFSLAMKAVDPTLKIGAVVTTPPGDYSWDSYGGQRWSSQVLQQCATNIDFIIAHWYPWIGDGSDGSNLLAAVRTTLPLMVNGTTTNLDFDTSAGLRDWIDTWRPNDGTNVQMFITEFGYFGSLATSARGPGNALFAGDSYATWMDLGVANIDYLEMSKTPFLGDSASLTRGAAYYAIQMVRKLAGPGDQLVNAVSDQQLLRAHASVRADGKLGLLLINENPSTTNTVTVVVTNASLAISGTRYQFGAANFSSVSETPLSGPSSNSVSGLGNSFSVSVPGFTMLVLVIPLASNTAPTLPPIDNEVVGVGNTLSFTASATDPEAPPQTLTFSLLEGPPDADLSASSGAFSWRPAVGYADTTNLVRVKVADNGMPSLSATQSFTVTVNPLALPELSASNGIDGSLRLRMSGDSGPDYLVQISTNLFDWTSLLLTNGPFQWPETNAALPCRFYRVLVGPPLP